MASGIQILLPLICVVLAEGHLDHNNFNKPFFGIPGLQHLAQPNPDVVRNKQPLDKNVDNNYDHSSWGRHVMGPQRQPVLSDGNIFPFDIHHGDRSFDPYNPFLHVGMDPYFGMRPYDMDNYDHIPGVDYLKIHNVFNTPRGEYHLHEHKPLSEANHPGEKPKHDHKDKIDVKNPEDKPQDKPTTKDKDPKLEETTIHPETINNPEELPPKTNVINKDVSLKEEGKKDDKQVGINKKKDFLLVGSGSNGNNVYLLHENNPNTNGVAMPNANQPNGNVVYVPYNPGQSTNQVYQVVTGQPAPLLTNQLTADKLNINGYNNGITNNGQSTLAMSANQNPNYVLIYSNGQVIKVPGVVLNTAQTNVPAQNGVLPQGTQYIVANALPNNMQTVQNNVPLQNGNPPQGTQYIVANTVPNNMHSVQNNVPLQNGNPPQGTQYIVANTVPNNMPSVQNPGTNVIYATLPNSGTNGQIYVQMPNCMHTIPNYVCSSGAVAQNPVQAVNNGGNAVPNNGSPGNVASYQSNQMMLTQPAVQISNDASNGYAPANLVSNQGQGPNVAVNIPSQGAVINNPSASYQPAVEMPVNSGSNGYNQAMVPNQGSNVPMNVPNQGGTLNNQNVQLQPAVSIPVHGVYNQPQTPEQGDQGTNAVGNIPSHDTVVNQPGINGPIAVPANAVPKTNAMVLDNNNLDALGAQPAIMISEFKESAGDKKDEPKKDKKNKKDISKKKDKKNKDADKSKELTNK